MPISPITHHLLFVSNEFSDSAQNSGLEATPKPFGQAKLPIPLTIQYAACKIYLGHLSTYITNPTHTLTWLMGSS